MSCFRLVRICFIGLFGLHGMIGLASCAQLPEAKVKPWQKADLARPEMSIEPDLLDASHREHTYSSKEASAGGGGVQGGGCGCN